jgi:hypothetical protein
MKQSLIERLNKLEAEQNAAGPRFYWHDAIPEGAEPEAELVVIAWEGELDDDDA